MSSARAAPRAQFGRHALERCAASPCAASRLGESLRERELLAVVGRRDVAADVEVVVVAGDLVEVGDVREAVVVREGRVGAQQCAGVLGFERVLVAARA